MAVLGVQLHIQSDLAAHSPQKIRAINAMDKVELVNHHFFHSIQQDFKARQFKLNLVAMFFALFQRAEGKTLGPAKKIHAVRNGTAHARSFVRNLQGGIALVESCLCPVQRVEHFLGRGDKRELGGHGLGYADSRIFDLASNACAGKSFRHVIKLRQFNGGDSQKVLALVVNPVSYCLFRSLEIK